MALIAINTTIVVQKKGFSNRPRRAIAMKEGAGKKDVMLAPDDDGKIQEVEIDQVQVVK